jgi:hypothetical protein
VITDCYRRTYGTAKKDVQGVLDSSLSLLNSFSDLVGHFPGLAIHVQNLGFQWHIMCLFVDKAHNMHTAGLLHYGLDSFHPAWGKLDELKAVLPQSMCWTLFSTTFPLHIHNTVEKNLLLPGYETVFIL